MKYVRLPSRPSRRARGYMLIELIVTIGLLSLVATLATQLLIRALGTGQEIQAGERESLAVDRAVTTLRQDVERTASLAAAGSVLTVGPVTWTAEPDALVRTADGQVRRFEPLPAAPAFAVANAVVTLRVGDEAWAFTPIVQSAGGAR